ncbi:MAG TPA: hypothetical protein DDW90_09005 [Cyanobacteria bacterium UBA9971]|nr:hypothetical protein [Cyanobacteria bacterium UBA9971]
MLKIIKTVFNTFVDWGNILNKPSTFTPSSHNHDDSYYTEAETDILLGNKVDKVTGERLINAAEISKVGYITVTEAINLTSFKSDYDAKINQDVRTTASPTFAAVNTDQINATGLIITSSDISKVGCTINTPLGLTANIQEWKYNNVIRSVINATGYLGLNTSNPQTPLHLVVGTAGTLPSAISSVSFLLQGNPSTTSFSETAMIAGTSGQCIMNFGDSDAKGAGRIIYDNSTDIMQLWAGSLNLLKLDKNNRSVTIGHDYWCSVSALATSFNLTGYKAKLKIQGNVTGQENGLQIYEADNYGYNLISDGANDKFIFQCNENTSLNTAYEIQRSSGTMTINKGIYSSSDGSTGATGAFTSADGKAVTVKDGIITNIA